MKLLYILIATICLGTCSSPTQSILFTNSSQHIQNDGLGNKIGSGKIEKFGKSCSVSGAIISFFFYGSGGSIEEAKANGNIKKIAVVDHESLNVFGFFYRECIVVWGE